MWKTVLFIASLAGVLLVAATSQSDVASSASDSASAVPVDEPTTEAPVMPAAGAGSARPVHDPFRPYDVGGSAAIWTYDDLLPAEQASADTAGDVTGWEQTNAIYTHAIAEQSAKAHAEAIARHLGLDNLAGLGVVP